MVMKMAKEKRQGYLREIERIRGRDKMLYLWDEVRKQHAITKEAVNA